MSFQSISVWCVCKLCRASFQKIEEFLKHKFEKHLIELQSIKCIILEEAKYDQDEQYHDFTLQQTRSPPSENIIIDDVAINVPTKTTPKPLPVEEKDELPSSSSNPNPEDSKTVENYSNKCYFPSPPPVIKTETTVIFQDNTDSDCGDGDGDCGTANSTLQHPPPNPLIKQEWMEVEMDEASSTNDDNLLNIKAEAATPDLDLDPDSSDFSHNVDVVIDIDIDVDRNFRGHVPQPKSELATFRSEDSVGILGKPGTAGTEITPLQKQSPGSSPCLKKELKSSDSDPLTNDCQSHSDIDRRYDKVISIESSPTMKPNPNTRETSSIKVKKLINNSHLKCKLCGKQFDREPEFKIHTTICLLYNNNNNNSNNKVQQKEPRSKETEEVSSPKIQSCFTTSENEKDRHRHSHRQEHPAEPMIFNPYSCPTSDLKSIYFTKTKTGNIVKSKTPTTGRCGRGLMERKGRQKGKLWIPPVLENPLELQ